ncbi:hypothetical protein ACFL54_07795 [Planctomycetota bacterium]
MTNKLRPGTSMHVILWLFVFTIVILSLLANYFIKVDPNYGKAQALAKKISSQLEIKQVRVLMKGKSSADPITRTLKISLYLDATRFDDEDARLSLMDQANAIALSYADLPAGVQRVYAKKQTGGGCKPTYTETFKDYSNPTYFKSKPKTIKIENKNKESSSDPGNDKDGPDKE